MMHVCRGCAIRPGHKSQIEQHNMVHEIARASPIKHAIIGASIGGLLTHMQMYISYGSLNAAMQQCVHDVAAHMFKCHAQR